MIRLGVNIDHVATVRQARQTTYPDPVHGALLAVQAGADNITCHLREDRRHLQDHDLKRLKETLPIPLNFEMAATEEMLAIALQVKPHTVTLVPEKRKELTTEGGLAKEQMNCSSFKFLVDQLKEAGIGVCLFVEPHRKSIELASQLQVLAVEFHTGDFCLALEEATRTASKKSLIKEMALICKEAKSADLQVHVGHGLNYQNAFYLQMIPEVEEANIGHAIVAQAVYTGMEQAVIKMKQLLNHTSHKPYVSL